MQVDVVAAVEADKPIVRRLLELSAHDLSELDGRDLGPHGEFGYRYLDLYWIASERHAFLVEVDGALAGCALVRAGDPHEMSEFFVLRKFRRRGVGLAAAQQLLARFPGAWVVHELVGNAAAVAFWRHAIPTPFAETVDDTGTTQRFAIGPGVSPVIP